MQKDEYEPSMVLHEARTPRRYEGKEMPCGLMAHISESCFDICGHGPNNKCKQS
jgi:hypothetical protein